MSRRLKEDLAKGETEVINNFKSSQAYTALMDAEYEAGVADSFESCWVKAVETIGGKFSEVTLENFPVPGASTTQGANMILDVNDSELTHSPARAGYGPDHLRVDSPLEPLNFEIPQEHLNQDDLDD